MGIGKSKDQAPTGSSPSGEREQPKQNTTATPTTAPARKSLWNLGGNRKTVSSPATPVAPPSNPEKHVFGVKFQMSLERSPDYNSTEDAKYIPIVVRKCCEFLNAKGLEEEGVYRIPGNRKNIDAYIEKFNSGT